MKRLLLPLLLLWQLPAAATDVARPNIVYILADDLGYGDLGCFGATDVLTPNLDRLAAEGTRLTSFYVAQPVCTASRAALLSGCYSNRVGMGGALNHTSTTGIHPEERLLSNLLQERGYATGAFGKWHLGHHSTFWPTNRGFNEFFGIPYSNDNGPLHPVTRGIPSLPLYEGEDILELDPDQSQFTRRITDRAVQFIERHQKEPFFLYVPHIMPHVPISVSEPWKGSSRRGLYGDVIQELDSSVGEILAELKRTGIEENTIVIFTSDNGPFLSYGAHAGSSGPFREGKLTAFEGGVRMPCLVRWPGKVPAGKVSDGIVTTMDLFTTLAGFGGAPLPKAKIDGLDLSGFLLGKPGAPVREEFWYYSGEELQAVRSGKWKLHLPHDYLTVAGEPGVGGKPSNFGKLQPRSILESGIHGIASRHGYRVETLALSLFDLETDPGETRNCAEEYPEIVARLQKVVEVARADLGDSLTGVKGAGVRAVGDVLPKLEPGVKRVPDLEYSRPATGALLLDLYLPEKTPEQPMPVVLWIHGGGWKNGSKEEYCVLTWLAAEGIAVASLNYRLVHEAQWPAQLEDCRAALAWLRHEGARYHLDPQKIGVAGGSAGGHMAALLGTLDARLQNGVSAVIDFFGPSDLLTMPRNVPGPGVTDADLARSMGARLLGGIVRDRPELARQASALHQVSAGDAPFLIFHGDKDRLVPLDQSERLDAALKTAGVPSKLVVLPGAGHGGWQFDTGEARQAIREFLHECLVR